MTSSDLVIGGVLSGSWAQSERGSSGSITTASNSHRDFRFLAEVIQHAVRLYHHFNLGLRDIETILAARGTIVCTVVATDVWRILYSLDGRLRAKTRTMRFAALAQAA